MTKFLAFIVAILCSGAIALGANLTPFSNTPYANVTAGASWTTSSTSVTLAASCPPNVAPATPVLDTTTNTVIGTVQGCVGATLSLSAAALAASNGSADVLKLYNNPSALSEPSQILATLNTLVGNINTGVSGTLARLSTPYNVATTTITTALSYTIPAGLLGNGQGLRVKAQGVNGGSASVNTITLSIGGSTIAIPVTGTSATWWVECNFGVQTAASAQVGECHGVQGSTALVTVQTAFTLNMLTTAQVVLLENTQVVASQLTITDAYIELVK